MGNPNYSELYKKRMREIYEEMNKERYYRSNGYVTRNGRAVTLGLIIAISSLMYIGKSCQDKDKNYNPKIEHLEDKIRGGNHKSLYLC